MFLSLEKQLEGFLMTEILKESGSICPGSPALRQQNPVNILVWQLNREIQAVHAQSRTFFEFLIFPRLCSRKIQSQNP